MQPVAVVVSHRRRPSQSALGLAERHNALFYLEKLTCPPPDLSAYATKTGRSLVLASLGAGDLTSDCAQFVIQAAGTGKPAVRRTSDHDGHLPFIGVESTISCIRSGRSVLGCERINSWQKPGFPRLVCAGFTKNTINSMTWVLSRGRADRGTRCPDWPCSTAPSIL